MEKAIKTPPIMYVVDASVVIKWFSGINERAIELAYEKNITIYDASYIALARQHQAFLITADIKFYKKMVNLPQIIALQDLQ